MGKLNKIINDEENKRIYQLTDNSVSAYSLNPPKRIWSELNYRWHEKEDFVPQDMAYDGKHLYISGDFHIIKLSSKDGSIVDKISHGLNDPSSLKINNDLLFVAGSEYLCAFAIFEKETMKKLGGESSPYL